MHIIIIDDKNKRVLTSESKFSEIYKHLTPEHEDYRIFTCNPKKVVITIPEEVDIKIEEHDSDSK